MSIMANYGPPADRNEGIKVIRAAYEKASPSLIQPKFTVHIQTKSLLEKRLRLSGTKWL